MRTDLLKQFQAQAYKAYVYSYPHKHAYQVFNKPRSLQEVWGKENKESLFLYLHIPFCEMRCGFCNLFTVSHPQQEIVDGYVSALVRQIDIVAEKLGDANFSRFAIGGGTPTLLPTEKLSYILNTIESVFDTNLSLIGTSIETSPKTLTAEHLTLFDAHNVERLSMGVQSFNEMEVKSLIRSQQNNEVQTKIQMIRDSKIKKLNLDLIYGIAGQTKFSWDATLTQTIEYHPEEIYLYPLYVRELTGLKRSGFNIDDIEHNTQRQELYHLARNKLLNAGYEQVSMRMFRLKEKKNSTQEKPEPLIYSCQEDGMLGLGCGARSYTRAMHYSTEYAVGRTASKGVIEAFNELPDEAMSIVDYGFVLSGGEQRRRYLLKSLLHVVGLELSAYSSFFNSDVMDDFPQLNELLQNELAYISDSHLCLNSKGIALSDAIGPWLASIEVSKKMDEFVLT